MTPMAGSATAPRSVEYLSEVLMVVSLDRDYVWGIGFANSAWSLQMDVDIPVQYRFGNGRWQSVNGYAVATDHLIVPMPQTEQAVDIFRRASLLELSFGEGDYQFDLTGTSRVTADVFGCVADHLDGTMSVPPPTETVAATPEPETTAAPEAQPEAPSGPSSGTGVLISTSGHILTNHHVIDGCSTVTVTRGSEVAAPAQILRIDQQNDLAVLTTDKTFPRGGRGEVPRWQSGAAGRDGRHLRLPAGRAAQHDGQHHRGQHHLADRRVGRCALLPDFGAGAAGQ